MAVWCINILIPIQPPPSYGYTNYWWGYYWHNGRGPYPYYPIAYNLDSHILHEPPQESRCGEGNPCNPATGDKFQTFIDYQSSYPSGLNFKRTYLSQTNHSAQFSHGWQHNYSSIMNPKKQRTILVSSSSGLSKVGLQQSSSYPTASDACSNGWQDIKTKAFRGFLVDALVEYAGGDLCHVKQAGKTVATLMIKSSGLAVPETPPIIPVHRIIRGNGDQYLFQLETSQWKELQHPEVTLVADGSNWIFTDSYDNKELYDDKGRLIQITNRQGQITLLNHDLSSAAGGDDNADTLDKVTDSFGHTLAFTYQTSNGKLASVNTPDGLIQYSYDVSENLTQVTYPDNKIETYHYEKSAFPNHLTGITDENNNRFATWDYDNQGRAILSEHAGHTEKVTFAYNTDGTTTVTDVLGSSRIYHFDWIQGRLKVKKITGDQCKTCGKGHMKERSYDANGFLSSHTDWNGNITTYINDPTGLELSRTEGFGTPEARTITTVWHTTFRLPIKVTKANKVIEYNYDPQGRLLSQTTHNTE